MKEDKDINPVDRLFKQSLEGYSPAPPASVWKGIRAKIGGGGKSPWQQLGPHGGSIVVSAVILSMAGLLAYQTYFRSSTQSVIQNNAAVQTSINKTDLNQGQASIKTPDIENQATADKPKTETQPIIGKVVSKVAAKTNNSDSDKPQNVVAQGKAHSAVSPETKSNSVHTKQSNNSKHEIAKLITSGTAPAKQNKNETPTVSENIKPVNQILSQSVSPQKPESVVVNYLLTEADGSKPSDSLAQNTADKPLKIKKTEYPIIPAAEISVAKNAKTSGPEMKIPDSNPSGNHPASTSSPTTSNAPAAALPELSGPNPFQYYFGLSGSMGKVMVKGLNPNNFYSVSALAGITHRKSGFGIETGIGYSYYQDRGIFEFEYKQTDTTGYKGYSLFNSYDSSYLVIFKPITSDTLVYSYTTTRTSYTYLKIPLYFTKQLFSAGNMGLGIKTGPSLDLLISRKVTQPGYTGNSGNLVSISNNSYTMLSTSWQWLIAPQLSWDLTDKIVFRFEPTLVFYLNNLYEPGNRPSYKPYGIGASAGFKYNF